MVLKGTTYEWTFAWNNVQCQILQNDNKKRLSDVSTSPGQGTL